MVFNAIFNNILAISLWPVFLVEETGIPGETTDLPLVTDKLEDIMSGIRTHKCRGYIGSCKSSYHTITTTMVPI